MIGASLIGSSGMPNWGGGSGPCRSAPPDSFFALCPDIGAPRPLPFVHFCANIPLTDNPFRWGSPEFIGLGFLSFISIVLTELFGSPFLKNISIIVGLAVGCIVAGGAGYFDSSSIQSAPAITFLWCVTFWNISEKGVLTPGKGSPFQDIYLSSSYFTYVCGLQ